MWLVLAVVLAATACAPASTSAPAQPATATAAPPAAAAPPSVSSAAPAAAGAYTPAPPLNPPVAVTVGLLRAMSESPLVIANERGYFTAEGLTVAFVEFTLTADALPALGTGELDAMSGGVNPALFNAVARGVNVQIVANGGTVGSGHDYQAVMVRTDHLESGRYKEPRDLKGMKVAIPGQYTVVHYMLKVLLEQNGLTLADVDAVPLPLPDSSQAMANKAVDALSSIEPFLAQTEQQGYGKRVAGMADIIPPTGIGGTLLMSPELPRRNAEAADRFMVAWLRGVRDYLDAFDKNQNREAMVELLRKNRINYVPIAETPTFDPSGRFPLENLQGFLEWCQQDGVVSERLDLNRIVDYSYVDRAAQRLGPYR
jgi:NitT/TauT family transport system substrate-binding protein